MDYPVSRAMSVASAAYGVFAAAKPRHLADNMGATGDQVEEYDRMAYAYALRDIPVSALALLGPARAVPVSMGLRIASDLTDAFVLGRRAPTPAIRNKILGVTLGWATLNAAALAFDRRR